MSENRTAVLILLTVLSALVLPFRAAAPIVPYDEVSMAFATTPQAAIASARVRCGNPELPLTLKGVRQLPDAPGRETYVLTSPGGQQFDVRCDDGAVSRWHSAAAFSAWADARRRRMTPAFSAEQVGAAATAFATQRYVGYVARRMQPIRNDGHTGEFVTVLPGQAHYGGNYCSVEVSEFTGSVLSFNAERSEGVAVATLPTASGLMAEV